MFYFFIYCISFFIIGFYGFIYFFVFFEFVKSIENPYNYILSAEGFDIFLLGEFKFITCGDNIGELWKVTFGEAILLFGKALLLSLSVFKELLRFIGLGDDWIGIFIYGIDYYIF